MVGIISLSSQILCLIKLVAKEVLPCTNQKCPALVFCLLLLSHLGHLGPLIGDKIGSHPKITGLFLMTYDT